ncbi:recombinase family protein [Paenibacillus terrae]|uniref:Resolvase/invertase-type recombinase catalytic domain-containing protein n=1 Tax=Paenibacillus terrae TaxID=159743 RepID=A0A0D7X703_9BACL|nr:recombinase family protein [Paenibacillus terrae]KJD46808.1 hypothetical protein QD47_04690 [Paenibacillus terrae]
MNIVIYLRVSSEQQAERELSIPAQREELQRYADERGWTVVDEYVDEAILIIFNYVNITKLFKRCFY